MPESSPTGRCLCGRITFRVTGPTVWSGYCHCESCRRFTGGLVTSWLGIDANDIEFAGDTPEYYVDGGVTRGFCGHCGSSLAYASERFPGYLQLHLGSLDDPAAIRPRAHVHHAERIDWFEIDDNLPRYPGSAANEDDGWKD